MTLDKYSILQYDATRFLNYIMNFILSPIKLYLVISHIEHIFKIGERVIRQNKQLAFFVVV